MPREVIVRIEKLGGVLVRQRGSHRLYRAIGSDGASAITTVAMHAKDIPLGTLKKIQKDLELVYGEGWLIK